MLGWNRRAGKRTRQHNSTQLSLEQLEDRTVPSAVNHLVWVNGHNALPRTTEDAKLLKFMGKSGRLADLTPPTITARLANDSAPGDAVNNDGLTNDPSIRGRLKDANKIKRFTAGLDGTPLASFVSVKEKLNAKNEFLFDRDVMKTINGGPLADGQHTLRLFASDNRGNKAQVFTVTFTLDTTAPAAPTDLTLDPASDSGASNDDRITNVTTPTISGKAQPGDVIRVSVDGAFAGQATAGNDGNWSLALAKLADGVRSITATASDLAGNASGASTPLSITIDTKITLPVFGLAEASDTGLLGDLLTDATNVTLEGTTEANGTVVLVQTGAATTADASGKFSFDNVALTQALNEFTVRVTDVAGNVREFTRTIMLNEGPAVGIAIEPITVTVGAVNTVINLFDHFVDPNFVNSTVIVDTILGEIPIELLDKLAPLNVNNFLKYVTDGDYVDNVFHRNVQGFVLQGGGYKFTANPGNLTHIATDPPVQNEFGTSNTRGTVAMAKTEGNPNSATSEWFVNLADNSANLDNQNGGFTVFGQVTGNGMNVVDSLSAIPPQNRNTTFNAIPLIDFPASSTFPTALTRDNVALINNVVATRLGDRLTFTVIGNDNPSLVTATITNNQLTLSYAAGQTGAAVITIQATDKNGMTTQTSFTVTVNPAP